MPDRTVTVATYAAGAGLAAIALVYVFGPTYLLDASSDRKKGVVGLTNPANDCFINSVLQALAGLGDLRLYLIRETHRRSLDDANVYTHVVSVGSLPGDAEHFRGDTPGWKMRGFQQGLVTKSLKDILDALNERPLYKKTISALPFVCAMEDAFRQRISRQQQDAQELLQIVAERLCNEYHAGKRARYYARRVGLMKRKITKTRQHSLGNGDERQEEQAAPGPDDLQDGENEQDSRRANVPKDSGDVGAVGEEQEEEGFPMEGRSESQIECLTCGFKPRPTSTTFCSLTLNVPQTSATTLVACFDGMFKTEYIDDFKCEKCRLVHAVELLQLEAKRAKSEEAAAKAQAAISKLELAIKTDPEHPPDDAVLPDSRLAPKRRIARHIRVTSFPKILAIHLSRSIFDAHYSQKNSAKVAFPNDLMLGGILNQMKYKLLAVVTHKGSHNSGHYETFRRQTLPEPFSNPSTFRSSEAYSRAASPASNRIKELGRQGRDGDGETASTSGPETSLALGPNSTVPAVQEPTPVPEPEGQGSGLQPTTSGNSVRAKDLEPSGLRSVAASARSTLSKVTSRSSSRNGRNSVGNATDQQLMAKQSPPPAKQPKRRKLPDRWWRISDDKIKEANTRDVLGMQREVYLLFYEMDKARTGL
ncbi:putative ubiquitin carboxyl-terminal hydrolase 16 [Podospora fimiseda]|uniref:Ubiquitin carboxyl-terminal hydrolase n=1 Tax=Podospora fimiseda TaxID=252190 RepID=A0AAN7H024_9PEZI|nr:putative ubiquitin carboxyl-terminal hydrolase 16 [Podospora fimiseda]